jgi:hypothetical protein
MSQNDVGAAIHLERLAAGAWRRCHGGSTGSIFQRIRNVIRIEPHQHEIRRKLRDVPP